MIAFLPALLAAAAFDGQAALRHASALAALVLALWTLATWVPAERATRVDPALTLRAE